MLDSYSQIMLIFSFLSDQFELLIIILEWILLKETINFFNSENCSLNNNKILSVEHILPTQGRWYRSTDQSEKGNDIRFEKEYFSYF